MSRSGSLFDLSGRRRLHVVGVGGPGMSAIALVLAEMGHRVSGSDLKETPYLERLRVAGVDVRLGHAPEHLDGVEAVVISTAIRDTNLEVQVARQRSIPVLRRAEMLAAICSRADSIGIGGTHGKTSTTSMLSLALDAAGFNPSFVVGGQVHEVGTGARWTGARHLVVECDESDGTFLELPLAAAVVTNVDADHLDHFGSMEAIRAGFAEFLAGVDGPRLVCADDPAALDIGRQVGALTYGTSADADVRVEVITGDHGLQHLDLWRSGVSLGHIELPLRGLHMARNATAAVAMAVELGAPFGAVAQALSRFAGVARRFEFRAEVGGITLVDDYGHLPAEIAATVQAAASGREWQRVVAVFQPNRYSRMAVLSPDYADAFTEADVVVIADVYPSGEAPIPGVTGELVVNAVRAAHPGTDLHYVAQRADLAPAVASLLRPGDICVSMGCGDVAGLPDEVAPLLGGGPR